MNRNWIRIILIALLILALLGTSVITFLPAAHANVPTMENIRVALFIDTGKYYRNVVPYVTLSSAQGLKLASKTANGPLPLTTVPANEKIRAGLDQFTLKVTETSDLAKAKETVSLLQTQSLSHTIWVHTTDSGKLYQVVSGSYSTADKAYAAAFNLTTATGLNPTVVGSERWVAGEFADEASALQRADQLAAKGFPAYITLVHLADGKISYQVRVGDEASADALQSLSDRLKAVFPDLNLSAVDPKQDYLLIRHTETTTGQVIKHYAFRKTGQKLAVSPNSAEASPPLIQVSERESRQYRGSFELTGYGGNMAVINELNMEQYLYSVVSSEMAGGWPAEALKAQAVASRTYAVGLGMKYVIAHLSDTTFDQAYKGYSIEKQDVREAVDATRGQVLLYNGRLASALYYSNAGGITAHPSEVWLSDIPHLRPVSSPDEGMLKGVGKWFRVMLKDGTIGYVHSDYVRKTTKQHATGRIYVEVLVPNLNFRTGPSTTEHTTIRTLNVGEEAVLLEELYQNSAYSWITGPVSAMDLMNTINSKTPTALTSPVLNLEVTQRGPSGRAKQVVANGKPIIVSSPDANRTALGGLRSTLFEVEQTGRYRVLGAGGRFVDLPQSDPNVLTAISAGGRVKEGLNGSHDSFFIEGSGKVTRIATESVQFRFIGKGFGHGLGMSQFGAKGLAEAGYGYADILKHYYSEQVEMTPVKP